MNLKTLRRLALIACAVSCGALAACDSARRTPPVAQESATAEPTAIVRVQSGASFSPACQLVDVGATVEWRNLSPRASVIVLSVREPYELSSPSLMSPYNIVPPEKSDECTQRVNGVCVEPLPFSYWRHTFTTPGIFDYQDQGGSATTTVGGYTYGMPPGPQTAASSRGVGTICVRGSSDDCQKVCCTGTVANECAPGVTCVGNRCGGVVP